MLGELDKHAAGEVGQDGPVVIITFIFDSFSICIRFYKLHHLLQGSFRLVLLAVVVWVGC